MGVDRILIQLSHPAHVHFYKNFIRECRERNVSIKVVVRDKDIAVDLLEYYEIPHEVIFEHPDESPIGLTEQLRYEWRTYEIVRAFNPDIITSVGGTAAAHVSTVTDAKSIIFTDSEAAIIGNMVTMPFADTVCTPEGYDADHGENHVRYPGYHELAYLHPENYKSNPDRLLDFGVDPSDKYAVVRFIGWGAVHDIGEHGFGQDDKRELISTLDEYATVYITSESALPSDFDDYRLPVPPHLLHDLLDHAALYVGDSQTMATEAAVLGTPAIRSNSFAGAGDMTNFLELEEEYRLMYSTPDPQVAIEKAETWIQAPNLESAWEERREQLLEDKIDVNEFITEMLLE